MDIRHIPVEDSYSDGPWSVRELFLSASSLLAGIRGKRRCGADCSCLQGRFRAYWVAVKKLKSSYSNGYI